MIAQIRGTLLERGIDHVVIEVGGLGLRLAISLHTLGALPSVGQTATLLTYLLVREDALVLFGFASAEERLAFELCLSVQQVGPKLAMSILSTLSPGDLAAAVRAGDHGRLQRIPGVGKKTAERLVLELKDKLDKVGLIGDGSSAPMVKKSGVSSKVVSALINLGYKPPEAEQAAAEALASQPSEPVEAQLKAALRRLAE